MSLRRLLVDKPFPARDDRGEQVTFGRPELWAYPSEDGQTEFVWDARFHFWTRTDVLERNTHPAS
jgi:hypothetical protein